MILKKKHQRILRIASYVVPLVFLIVGLVELFYSVDVLLDHTTRGAPINVGFQTFYLLSLIPLIFGIRSKTKELLIIFIICCGHSIIISILSLAKAFGFYIVNIPVLCVLIHAGCLAIIILCWMQYRDSEKINLPVEKKVEESYELKRFGNLRYK